MADRIATAVNSGAGDTCPFTNSAPSAVPDHVPPQLVRHYDYMADPRIATKLWELSAAMADGPEIFWSTAQGGHWVAASAEALQAIFDRPDLFTSSTSRIPAPESMPRFIPAGLDPPEHTVFRKQMTQKMFSVRALGNIEEEVATICSAVLDEFSGVGHGDFVSAFARRVPVDLFLSLMGVASEKRQDFLDWVERIFRPKDRDDLGDAFAQASTFTSAWLDEQFAQQANRGRLFLALEAMDIDGRPLTPDEMRNITMMLFIGGLDTVVSQLTHIGGYLAENADQQLWLRNHPERLPGAVEELLRRFGIANIVRAATKDVEFHGVRFRRGDPILLSMAFANLDRRAFDDPLRVDFDRVARIRHWAFGHGIHLCIGAHLARVQVQESLRQILQRLPNLRLAPGADLRIESGSTFIISSLPVEWDPVS